jgi:hypothetical protein
LFINQLEAVDYVAGVTIKRDRILLDGFLNFGMGFVIRNKYKADFDLLAFVQASHEFIKNPLFDEILAGKYASIDEALGIDF